MPNERCARCHRESSSTAGVVLREKRRLQWTCDTCVVAQIAGDLEADGASPSSLILPDIDRVKHEFTITAQELDHGVIMTATEKKKAGAHGYGFHVLGEHGADWNLVFQGLYEKMKLALSRKHLEYKEELSDKWCVKANKVRGHLTYDTKSQRGLPLLVVDGKAFTWEDFGRIILCYEGWDFVLEFVADRDDE